MSLLIAAFSFRSLSAVLAAASAAALYVCGYFGVRAYVYVCSYALPYRRKYIRFIREFYSFLRRTGIDAYGQCDPQIQSERFQLCNNLHLLITHTMLKYTKIWCNRLLVRSATNTIENHINMLLTSLLLCHFYWKNGEEEASLGETFSRFSWHFAAIKILLDIEPSKCLYCAWH